MRLKAGILHVAFSDQHTSKGSSMTKQTDHTKTVSHASILRGRRRAAGWLSASFLAALVLSGCDKPAPEAQLTAAGEALGEATTELADLDKRIEQTEELLDELRSERRKQRDTVRTLEQRLEARATDVAIFRSVQTALLGDERLQDVAIAVDVEDRAVTLSGLVRAPEQADQAVELSKQIAGVETVSSRIRVDDPQSKKDNGA